MVSVSCSTSRVRGAELPQHDFVQAPAQSLYAVIAASGMPRLWHRALGAAGDGLRASAPLSGIVGMEHLRQACQNARSALIEESARLLERQPLDVGCAAVRVEHGVVHVVATGSMRAYVARPKNAVPERITPRDAKPTGLLEGDLNGCSISVQPTDLVVLGTDSTFTTQAIERFQNRFVQYRSDPRVPSKRLLDAWVAELTTPHMADGTGSGAMLVAAM